MKTRVLPFSARAVLLAVLSPAAGLWAADGDGVIKGTLVNRTPGGAGVADTAVILQTYVGGQERSQATARTDSQGRFEFPGLSTAANYNYSLIVHYQEAEYIVGPKRFDQGTTTLPWEVPVYDATPKPDAIRIARGHLIISFSEDMLSVFQYFSFVNTGNKTFVGSNPITPDGKKETLRLSLPTGADQVTSDEGLDECCAFRTDDGISDTLAVPPGNKDIVLSYQMPYKSSTVFLDLPLYYPMDNFNLLIGDQNVKVSSPQLRPQGTQDMGGQKYLHYAASNLPAEAELSLDLDNLPQKNVVPSLLSPNNLRWGGAGLAALAIGFAIFYSLRRRPAMAPAAAGAAAGTAPSQRVPGRASTRRRPDQADILLRELAELDDRFAAGQIREDEYAKKRDQKKTRLKELMASQEEGA